MNYDLLKKQNFLTEYAQEKPEIITFLLKRTFNAIRSNRKHLIYTPPFPGLKDSFLISTPESLVKTIQSYKSDAKLPFESAMYNFIVFSIYQTPIIFKKCNVLKTKDFEQYKVLNTLEKEEAFKKISDQRCYLFHGSRMENWYSIIKNGIKNCSNSKLMTCGAAYGAGVYLSDNISVSVGYSDGIIGVFELAGDKGEYRKAQGIYVVPDEKKLLLRYFVVYNNQNRYSLSTEINKYFGSIIHKEKTGLKTMSHKLSNKRLNREFKELLDKKTSDDFSLINGDEFMWKVTLKEFDKDSNIQKELKENNIPGVELEIRIPKKYPFQAPFVRVVSPVFKYRTGHITVGGSLCVDILTALGWSPCYTISQLVLQIKTLIVDAEIDTTTNKKFYTYEEAKGAFDRVARDHGWLR